jgi:molybdopterin molybdotransferase
MALTPLPEALERILATAVADPEREQVSLAAAMDRYCAEAVQADIAVPPADNSAMDGYAVASGDVPGTLVVSQRAPAGALPAPLAAGTAARIFTGAEIPVGADAVILQEDATVESDRVSLPAARPGQHIRRRGDDIRPGDELVARGQRIRPQDIGLLASVGNDTVWVFAPLSVAY